MKKSNNEVKKLGKIIASKIKVKKIILFGSYASGKQNDDSDIDLCILTDEKKRKIDLIREVRKSLYDHSKKPLDILVYNTDEFYERANSIKSIEREILKEGIMIYE